MSSPESSLRIRSAGKADAEQLTALINLAFWEVENFFIDGDRIDLATVYQHLDAGEFLVAEKNGEFVGCVYLEPRGERTYLGLLSVNPGLQGAGIGSRLMSFSEDRCRAQNSKYIDILTVNLREELPAYYMKRGYVVTGTSPFPAEVPTKIPCHFVNMSKKLVN